MTVKRALITGAFGSLGKELSERFSCAGFKVTQQGRAKQSTVPWYDFVPGDLRMSDTLNRIAEHVGDVPLDVLVHNAALYEKASIDAINKDKITAMIQTNLIAPIFLTQKLWPSLVKAKGMVIFINSLAGKIGTAGESVYSATKQGLRGFVEGLQYDGVPVGVRVLNVFCGAFQSKITQSRNDYEKLIRPSEIASQVVSMVDVRGSMRITEIEIMRTQY